MEELDVILGKSVSTWAKLLNYIRTKYIMDEYWDGKNELKLRCGGKTYHDGKWMLFDVHDDEYLDSFIKLLNIKRKPNQKKKI